MVLIFLCAGIFAGVLGREGATAVADLMLSVIPARFSVLVMFVVACFVSTAMGTSVGTITVLAPVGAALAASTGVSPVLVVASVVGGAMFGDNLSFISDTTIAATSTQGCQMRDKFRENFFIALPAALLTIGILLVIALTGEGVNEYVPQPINLWLLLPYFLVLIGGVLGINVFLVLLVGIAVAVIVKLALGIGMASIISAMGSGASGMFEVIIVTLLVSMLSALMREFGGFDALLAGIKRVFRGRVGGQLGIATLVSAMDVATANNTVAIVMSAPIAKTISEEYGITNTKTASLLDIFGSVAQGLIPYGAQLLIASQLTGISAAQMMPYMFYQYLLAVSAVIFMFLPSFKIGRKKA
jgi:Na+/H+ antiporter NhaC